MLYASHWLRVFLWTLGVWTLAAQTPEFDGRAQQVRDLSRDQQFSQARDVARRLVTDCESAPGTESQQLATALELLAGSEIGNANNTKPVEELLDRAAAIELHLGGEHTQVFANNLAAHGRLLASRNLFREASALLEQALALQESLEAPPLALAETLHSLARATEGAGRYPQAIAAAHRSLALREAASGAESRDAGIGHYILGYSLQRVQPVEGSVELLRALTLVEKFAGPVHPEVGDIAESLGRLEYAMKHYPESQKWYERVIVIVEKNFSPTHARFVSLLNNYGLSRKMQGDYAGCRQAFERALIISEATYGADDSRTAQLLGNLGIVLQDMGDYPGALRSYERALAIQKKLLGDDHQLVGRIHRSMLRLHHVLGDLGGAERHCNRAFAIFEKALGPDNEATLDAGVSCVLLLNAMGRNQDALPLAQRTMAGALRTHGQDSRNVGVLHRALGLIYFDLGQAAPAREHLQQAVTLARKHHDLSSEAISSRHLSRLASKENNLVGALQYAVSAREIAAGYFGARSPDLSAFLNVEALALAASGRREEAFRAAAASEELRQHSIRATAGGVPERLAMSYVSEDHPSIELVQQWMRTDDEQRRSWDLVVRGRNIVLDVTASRSREWRRQADPQTARDWTLLKAARAQLAAVAIRTAGGDIVNATRDLERAGAEKERIESRLSANNAGVRDELQRAGAGLPDVLKNLPPRTALVAFTAGDRYRAFVASYGGGVRTFDLGNSASIDALVASWRREILRERDSYGRNRAVNEKAYLVAASALRRAVWDPLRGAIGSAAGVFLVPDGSLLDINFLALPATETKYLAEVGPILHVLNAERDLLPREPVRLPPGKTLLAVGNPAFDGMVTTNVSALPVTVARQPEKALYGESGCAAFRDLRFAPLPGSGVEAVETARFGRAQGWHTEILQGAAASEKAFKQIVQGQRVIHIATHGFFLDRKCSPSADDNPLLRAGLALAGANRRASAKSDEEDGVLTAEEAATLNLDGTEWLVLSGCDTGAGEIRAHEGIIGLRRAFQVAGARTLISSLWAVRDDDARHWMSALYSARFQHHRGTADAIADANRGELARRRSLALSTHPFHWASFVASGDWR